MAQARERTLAAWAVGLLLGASSSAVAAPPPAAPPAAEIPDALIVLETAPGTPGSDPTSAPPRFVLLKDGQLFVGGTGRLEAGRLEKPEVQGLRRRADALRKAAGRAGTLAFGGDEHRVARLRLPEDGPVEITITGDPALAPPALRPAAGLVSELLSFDHPSLAPYAPGSYAVRAREGGLVGGCRPWRFPFSVEDAVSGPRVVTAGEAEGWPTGAWPASVCVGDKRYVVTLRPLLPGERPAPRD
jgi:hypothetical protein